ncbi:3',5'-cyclic-nucleotide phosphodiesterase PDE2 [Paracoccidioides brasiliensis Pb18]|uniref:Phosphodiesterase n=1 Tax=Paracoccidioides brasiliensis (strain Pb18) TaxID=502780 RepID=C1G9S6_PARBD|nr:3',5'-cyclic-nucleotide phosphodiesterase PDE2 [Paracoccidioides brasiliensis Pb18]EEH47928.1 hypothetical protein PADG_04012 [Paracoccidioides brasiliensis Pb18]
MDPGDSCAVYLDDRVKEQRWVVRNASTSSETKVTGLQCAIPEDPELHTNVELFLGVFKKVFLTKSRKEFAKILTEVNESCRPNSNPLFALVAISIIGSSQDTPQSSEHPPNSTLTKPPSRRTEVGRVLPFSSDEDEFCAIDLLARFSSNLKAQDEVNLAVPIAVLRFVQENDGEIYSTQREEDFSMVTKCINRCLDAGVVDVLISPLDAPRVQALLVHAYRIHKSAREEQLQSTENRKLRKHSWVGASDSQQPYGYLRELMVTKLMKRICNPEEEVEDSQTRYASSLKVSQDTRGLAGPGNLEILHDRKHLVEIEISTWSFSAHDFSEDELVHASFTMIQHALKMPELEHWRIPSTELHSFLLATRATYNSFVLYHNFRHAVDVLQSTFHLLVCMGVLPRYPDGITQCSTRSPIALLLTPFDALTLLITALGHDVGHPGVNNIFLVKLSAPLAQLYNDTSVLESFHCAAFSQILRMHWPVVFADMKLRKLMISSILATDMGIHFKFMESLNALQEKYHKSHTTQGWKPQDIEAHRSLLCGLLIKCADISNVARPWVIAERWTNILQEEFAHQGEMEKNVGIETALFGGPPELGNIPKLAKGQMDFMKLFALPLFEGMADIIPEMAFTAVEIRRNWSTWQRLVSGDLHSMSSHEASSQQARPSSDLASVEPVGKPLQGTVVDREKTPPASSLPLSRTADHVPPTKDSGIDGNLEAEKGNMGTPDISSSAVSTTASEHNDSAADGNQVSNSRRVQSHRLSQRWSTRPSTIIAPNRQSEVTLGTRTQSASTYTNNTVVTPISSTTQASSFISVGSSNGDQDYVNPASEPDPENSFPSCNSQGLAEQDNGEGSSNRPTPVAISAGPGRPHHLHPYHNIVNGSNGKSPHFMSALIDRSFGTNKSNGFSITNPTCSTSDNNCHPTGNPHFSNHDPLPNHNTSNNMNGNTNRSISRRRSRLRLAFWRRNTTDNSRSP